MDGLDRLQRGFVPCRVRDRTVAACGRFVWYHRADCVHERRHATWGQVDDYWKNDGLSGNPDTACKNHRAGVGSQIFSGAASGRRWDSFRRHCSVRWPLLEACRLQKRREATEERASTFEPNGYERMPQLQD